MQRSLGKLFSERNEPALLVEEREALAFIPNGICPMLGPGWEKGAKIPEAQQLSWDKGNPTNFNGRV